jgi:hypothetical protein
MADVSDPFIDLQASLRQLHERDTALRLDDGNLRQLHSFLEKEQQLLVDLNVSKSLTGLQSPVIDDIQWLTSADVWDVFANFSNEMPEIYPSNALGVLTALEIARELHPNFLGQLIAARKVNATKALVTSLLADGDFNPLFETRYEQSIHSRLGEKPNFTLQVSEKSIDAVSLDELTALRQWISYELSNTANKIAILKADALAIEKAWLSDNGIQNFTTVNEVTQWVLKRLPGVDASSWTNKNEWLAAVKFLQGLDEVQKCDSCSRLSDHPLQLTRHALETHFHIPQEDFIARTIKGFESDWILFLIPEGHRLDLIKELIKESGFENPIRDLFLNICTTGPKQTLSRFDLEKVKGQISKERFIRGLELLGLRGDKWVSFLEANQAKICRYNFTVEHFEEFVSNRQRSPGFRALQVSMTRKKL